MPDALPGWLPMLHEAWAAAYLSLSPSTFRQQVAPDVPPVRLTQRRVHWLRADLDKWLAQQAADRAGSLLPNLWDDD